MQRRLETIDNVKILMMLAVVLYHSCMFFTGSWFDGAKPVYEARYLSIFAQWLNTFHVQTFTLASGFLFYCLRMEKGKYTDFGKDVLKRGKRLLLPYFCVMLTWVIPFYVHYSGFELSQIVYKYVLGCAPSQLWFLPMLFLLFVFFYRILDEKYVSTQGMLAVATISIGGGYLLDKIGVNVFQISAAVKYAGYYYFGAYVYKMKAEKRWMLPISAFGSIAIFIIGKIIKANITASVLVRLIGSILGYMCSYMGVVFIYYSVKIITERLIDARKPKIWNELKKMSFGIYLFHQQIIYLTIIPLNGKVPPIVQVVIGFVCAIGVASLITAVLKRFKLTRTLYGV